MELLTLLLNLRYLVGFVRSGVFKPKLTAAEEEALIGELFDPRTHERAREALIEHNLRLVAHIVKKYDCTREPAEDLISIGTIGLIKAVDTYSQSKSVKLATYAAKCIENEILMTLRANKKRSKDTLLSEAVNANREEGEISLLDVIPAEEVDIADTLDKRERLRRLEIYLQTLDERELQIITLRYGLLGESEKTQKEIAKIYHISRSYVSRIEKRALAKLWQEFRRDDMKKRTP